MAAAATTKRVALFSATTGDYELRTMPAAKKPQLKALQTMVDGNIEMIPHKLGPTNPPFVAYANEEGFNLRLRPNYTAWGTLMQLGFHDSGIDGAFFGNIVVMAPKQRSLTDKDVETIKQAHARYIKELEDGDDAEEEEKSDGPPPLERSTGED